MKTIDINISINEADIDELAPEERALVTAAKRAAVKAYAPYSHFHVGAAILLSNNEIIEGNNQENAAFPSGMCAERTACYYAHARYPEATFEAIAIAACDQSGAFTEEPVSPCGACRQALLEYEALAGKPVRVILAGKHKALIIRSISELLPLSFSSFN